MQGLVLILPGSLTINKFFTNLRTMAEEYHNKDFDEGMFTNVFLAKERKMFSRKAVINQEQQAMSWIAAKPVSMKWKCNLRAKKQINLPKLAANDFEIWALGCKSAHEKTKKPSNFNTVSLPEVITVSYTHLTLPTKRIV